MDRLKMMKIISVFLLLAFRAEAQDTLTEITGTGSGDGYPLVPTTANVSLIDDNGDISTVVTAMDNGTNPDSLGGNSTLNSDTTVAVTSTTVTVTTTPMDVTDGSPPTVSATDPPTTVTTTESTTTTVTTTESIPSTTISTTTTTEATTTTTIKSTTKKPTTAVSTTTIMEKSKPKPATVKGPTMPTVSTTFIPGDSGKHCSFLDSELMCEEELVCYGEGEIDCTEDAELDPAETSLIDKISSSESQDYSDYEADGETIGTFPPKLVGGKSQKKEPTLFRLGSLETYYNRAENNSEMDNETEEGAMTVTTVRSASSIVPATEEVLNSEIESGANATVDSEVKDKAPEIMVIEDFLNIEIFEDTPSASTISSTNTPEEEQAEKLSPSNEIMPENTASDNETTAQGPVTTVEYVTSRTVTELPKEEMPVTEASAEQSVNVRRKREENASDTLSSSSSAPFKVAALESSKKRMRVKSCRLSGNLVCTPTPTMSICKGKTFCQAIRGTAETSEKSTTQNGVENWAIAVITICAIAAGLTIGLLVYLVFTSWKKLKVQPQNEVTTLNYVNSAEP